MEKNHIDDGLSTSIKVSNVSDAKHKEKKSCSDAESSSECEKQKKIEELTISQTNDTFIYRQDVIKSSKHEDFLGIVVEVAGDSDSEDSISDDDDSEMDEEKVDAGIGGGDNDNDNTNNDEDNINYLPNGQVRITWCDGSETTENTSDIVVVDRSFLHGDIVTSAIDPTGQLGLVVNINITVELLSADGEVIKNVNSRDLKRIREFSAGDFVVLGPWLGRVDEVLDNVTVLFDDGSVCKVVKADPLRLNPVLKPVVDNADCPYYPGQRVRAVSSAVFKTSRWLSGLWRSNLLEGTVIKVQTGSVVVYWMASAYLGVGTGSTSAPADEQNPKNLTLLSFYAHTNWQLADWCLLPSYQQLSSSADSIRINSKMKEAVSDSISHFEENQLSSCILDEVSPTGTELEATDDCFLVHSSHCINSDIPDSQCMLGKDIDGSSEVSSTSKEFHGHSHQSQSEDYLNDHLTAKLGQVDGTESTDFPEKCSCSSPSISKEAVHESWPTYRKNLRKVFFKREKKTRRRNDNFESALFIINTVTKVDVAWQDGRKEYGLQSTSLIPISTPNDNEFFPEQYVVEKASNEEDGSFEVCRTGVVRTVNSQERTVCVRWLKPVSRPEDLKEFMCEEIVSAYELDPHPDYDYCYGDVVVCLPTTSDDSTKFEIPTKADGNQLDTEVISADSKKEYKGADKDTLVQNYDVCENVRSLSWVGTVIGLQDGDIEVNWADGTISKVGPQEVYVVDGDDDEVSDDGASWETVDENEMDVLDGIEKEADLHDHSDNTIQKGKRSETSQEDITGGRSGPLAVPLTALDFVTKFATGLFFRAKKQLNALGSDQIGGNNAECEMDLAASESIVDVEDENKVSDVSDYNITQSTHQNSELMNNQEATTENVEINIHYPSVQPASIGPDIGSRTSYDMDDPYNFKHFDVAENPSDHHYLGDAEKCSGQRKWVKKVQQEWSILEKNLPDAIYVRVFEDHIDLMRAVIVGASGTPYHDGLFFFDFHLPPEYPEVPPSVYYHSGGLRINPNLYVDGKVCLSLLNTWTGKGNEVWDSSSSSILQVLISLQGLVLNDKPYFNEAGYEKQIGTVEGEKNVIPYNENTYLMNLKSMMYLLRRPPMHFEDFVKDHFRRHGYYILKACEAYMAGSMIGSLTTDGCPTEKSQEHSCSVGFKLTLAKILQRLILAFDEVGIDRCQFKHLLKSENPPES
ncbi:probable ubiquitin-conjugating enzyme E2 23 isoform X1 [Zingiber officinale]|uniref:E2 ubiquitin-conjugating enzyme n=2 Tax=Zingiber officinale TaxID=94328 RepID=A0A8J5HU61_ZINOF|nr:probable ubiquitin-conjugating enzyme E2 23 isoform X1 [Zingiber officinale]KAG6523458.1 hypothetical protein ZIOFF_013316 [Zingiber officinale]